MNLGERVAVIMAGAVAKGAFEAGALKVLAEKLAAEGGRIVRVVAASSGALNGTLLASGVHAGDTLGATQKLADLWVREGDLFHAFHLNLADLIGLRGASDQKNLIELLSSHVQPRPSGERVELRIIVATLAGSDGRIGGDTATTFERVLRFDQRHFESDTGIREVFAAAAASASFPGAFAPFAPNPDAGPCVDGGAVNNTPIKYALEGGDIDSLVVIAPTVERVPRGALADFSGPSLVSHVADVLINERLYRDLHDAEDMNESLRKLQALGLPQETLDRVMRALGWREKRIVPIVRIRPLEPLPATSFSGFIHPSLRKQYVDLGEERARAVL
jgi:NTE family protein